MKRVVATGGQTISCCGEDGKLRIDGQPLDEPYIFEDLPFEAGSIDCQTSPRSLRCVPAFTVPEGELVVLGDHRSVSVDSAIACRSLTAVRRRLHQDDQVLGRRRSGGGEVLAAGPRRRSGLSPREKKIPSERCSEGISSCYRAATGSAVD